MGITVCKECPERTVGCHSTCERYKAEVEENRKENERRRAKRLKDRDVTEARKHGFDTLSYSKNRRY